MKSFAIRSTRGLHAVLLPLVFAAVAAPIFSQAQPPASASTLNASRLVGTITAVGTGQVTVKTDGDGERKVTVPDGIKMQRIAPGEKDLSKAASIEFKDLAIGDRVLVRLAPDRTSDPVLAISIIAIPQADVAQKQQRDREDWQKRGIGGLVKSVNAGTGIVVITTGAGPTARTITLHTTPATVLRRYANDSVSFDLAKPAPLEVIQAGDQLRARGMKSEDGSELAAEDVISGSFRNISGTVISVNVTGMTLVVKDLTTKQPVTVHIGAEVQMRKLPEMMARMLAASAKPADAATPANPAAGGKPEMAGNAASMAGQGQAPGGTPRTWNGAPGGSPNGSPNGPPAAANGAANGGWQAGARNGGGDPQQMLSRAPAIHLADLQKGDAVMLVSTQGAADVTAITLLAGVEPLLQSPSSTQNMLLSNWNMSSGGAEAAQ